MATLAPSIAGLRAAVREALVAVRLPPGSPVVVACSGGADSMALAAAAAFVAPRLGLRPGLVTVDHQLQPGSAERAAAVVSWAASAGFEPAEAVEVTVPGRPGGPEAAARDARYEALLDAARRAGAPVVLLGHTRDDQAETVLLALARGAGARGLAGMPVGREVAGVRLLRPLLDVSRADTRSACAALGLRVWQDPHNTDPSYARARVRAHALPALVDALGVAVVANLARTAKLAAVDAAALDSLADAALATAREPPGTPAGGSAPAGGVAGGSAPAGGVAGGSAPAGGVASAGGSAGACRLARAGGSSPGTGLLVTVLAGLLPAVRSRVLHGWARELGAPGAALSHTHVTALDALVTCWHGQGPVYLPGGIMVTRRDGVLKPG